MDRAGADEDIARLDVAEFGPRPDGTAAIEADPLDRRASKWLPNRIESGVSGLV